MAELDQRCFFEDDVIEQLFYFVQQKQNGQVCFGAVVGLALEILKERTSYVPPVNETQNKKQQKILEYISSIIDQLSTDLIHQMKSIYQQCLEEQFRNLDVLHQNSFEQSQTRIKANDDPNTGVDMSLITKRLDKIYSQETKDKKNIEILFKSVLNEENKVIPSEFTNLINLLEQYQTNFFNDDDSFDSPKYKNKKHIKENYQDDKVCKKDENLEFLLNKMDVLRETKGQNKQYYEIMDEMFNNLLFVQTKFQTYEMIRDSQTRDIVGLQEENVKLEQKAVYFETELHHIISQKENIEYKLDKVCKENDAYKQKFLNVYEATQQNNQSTLLENIQILEAQFAPLQRKLKEIEKKYEDIQVENKELQNESDKMFELYKQAQEELDSLKQQKVLQEISQPKSIIESQQKVYEKQILRFQEENKYLKNKLQKQNEEVSKYKQQIDQREEEYLDLQKVNKQLQNKYEEACVISREVPIRYQNDRGRISSINSIKPLSGCMGFSSNSVKKSFVHPMQFGQTRNSILDTEEEKNTNYNSNRNTYTEPNADRKSYPKINIINDNIKSISYIIDNDENQKMNTDNSQNSIPSGSLLQEDNQISISCNNTWPNHHEELIPKQNTTNQLNLANFDKYWNQFQNRMSITNQNLQMQKQVNNQEQNKYAQDPYHPSYYASFFVFNNEQLYSRDFLGLRYNKQIVQLINENKCNDNLDEMRCFSDTVFSIIKENEKQKKILFATPYNIYILNNKNYKLIRRIQIDQITKILFLENSPFIFAINVFNEKDEIIDAYSRADFNIFLLQALKERDLKPHNIEYTKEINLNANDKIKSEQNEDDCFRNQLQVSFKSACMYGCLKICESNWILDFFSEPWKEYFFVLTNIGLFSFCKMNNTKPQLYIPINDAQVIKDPEGCNQENCIKIYYQHSNQEYILSCNNKGDQDKWIESIKKQFRT